VALSGSGSAVSAYGLTATSFADCGGGAYLNTGNTVGASVIYILDYTNSNKYKTVRGMSGTENNGIGTVGVASGLWLSTAAVTSVTVFQQNANFTNKSRYALYGIKG
jgi:hypothetical protein